MHAHPVEVALVDGAGDRQLGAQAHGHTVQMLPVDRRDRGLPRHRKPERDRALLTGFQPERPADLEALELDGAVVLTVAVLDLDPGHHAERDILDVGGVVAALDVDLALQVLTGMSVRAGQDGIHGRAAGAESPHQLLENHDATLTRGTVWLGRVGVLVTHW